MDVLPTYDENFSKIVKKWQVNNLIGKLMLIIEGMGLQKGQEEAVKSLIKQEIWKEINEGIYISPEVQKINQEESVRVVNDRLIEIIAANITPQI